MLKYIGLVIGLLMVGATIGFGLCACLAASKIAELEGENDRLYELCMDIALRNRKKAMAEMIKGGTDVCPYDKQSKCNDCEQYPCNLVDTSECGGI